MSLGRPAAGVDNSRRVEIVNVMKDVCEEACNQCSQDLFGERCEEFCEASFTYNGGGVCGEDSLGQPVISASLEESGSSAGLCMSLGRPAAGVNDAQRTEIVNVRKDVWEEACYPCSQNLFGERCEEFCEASVTYNGGGVCGEGGACNCFPCFTGVCHGLSQIGSF